MRLPPPARTRADCCPSLHTHGRTLTPHTSFAHSQPAPPDESRTGGRRRRRPASIPAGGLSASAAPGRGPDFPAAPLRNVLRPHFSFLGSAGADRNAAATAVAAAAPTARPSLAARPPGARPRPPCAASARPSGCCCCFWAPVAPPPASTSRKGRAATGPWSASPPGSGKRAPPRRPEGGRAARHGCETSRASKRRTSGSPLTRSRTRGRGSEVLKNAGL